MPRGIRQILSLCLCGASLWICGCELPRGPISPVPWWRSWRQAPPVGPLPDSQAGLADAPGEPNRMTGDCQIRNRKARCADCAQHPPGYTSANNAPLNAVPPPPPEFTPHGVQPPWPRYHPVPTRPVFESRDYVSVQ
ncbi:MAG: hypothetical protein SFX18_15070 [Pirellulales bacterium]|nr:hypothetical protein [Pirellulales bacterium]